MNKNLQFGMSLGLYDTEHFIERLKLVESAGFDYCWINETDLHKDVFLMLNLAALNTMRIKLGPCVTNPYVRSPGIIASAIATLGAVSGWRATLGMGVGGYRMLNSLGIKTWEKPLTAIVEATEIIRRLLDGEQVTYDGQIFKTNRAKILISVPCKIPIYLGAFGIKMSQLAGRIADGVFISNVGKYTSVQIDQIKQGAETAGRNLSDVQIVLGVVLYISEDEARIKELARNAVAELFISDARFDSALRTNDVDMEEVYRARSSKNRRVCVDMVTDEMLDDFCVAGNPEQCTEKIAALVKRYAPDQIRLFMYKTEGEELEKGIGLFRDKVLPTFR